MSVRKPRSKGPDGRGPGSWRADSRWLRGQGLMPWGSAVFEEEKVAVTLGDGVGGKAGGRDGGGEAGGLIVEEALDGAEVLADLGAAGAGAGVLEEAQAKIDEDLARCAAQEGPPHLRPSRGQPPEAVHVGVAGEGAPGAPARRGGGGAEGREPRQSAEGPAPAAARAGNAPGG